MAKGRSGMYLESAKFALYLLIPIAASVHYNNIANQKRAADYWQFVRYPANPTTGWRESIAQAAAQQEQRQIYRQQLLLLNQNNDNNNDDENNTTKSKSDPEPPNQNETEQQQQTSWWRR